MQEDIEQATLWLQQTFHSKWKSFIGIAPFAQHGEKCLPEETVRAYARLKVAEGNAVIWFGGGKSEVALLNEWVEDGMASMAGQLNLRAEIALMMQLSYLLCMDSGNMHLAALAGVRVKAVFGPTHPYLGFAPYGQEQNGVVQIDPEKLSCRPCSVFGNKACKRGDHACMTMINIGNL
jgi:ADP-heptose:LPS heptosyltransferase